MEFRVFFFFFFFFFVDRNVLDTEHDNRTNSFKKIAARLHCLVDSKTTIRDNANFLILRILRLLKHIYLLSKTKVESIHACDNYLCEFECLEMNKTELILTT